MEKIIYLSDEIQNCFNDLFFTSYKKNNDFEKTVIEISNYLLRESNKYDGTLNKYEGVNKTLLKQMILSNFLEITYYRRKNGIKLDETRLSILNQVETTDLNSDVIIPLLQSDIYKFVIMINDVLLYFLHSSQMYSYNIVKSINEDGFAKKLYRIYPLALNEHMLTLDDSYNEKEFLLYTLIEVMINTTERLTFSKGKYPIPDSGYLQDIVNILKKYNGSNPTLPNLHKEILEEFNFRVGISKGNSYYKILLLEILLSTVNAKDNCCIPKNKDEKQILEKLHKINFSMENLSGLYDDNEEKIISTLINNWNMFSNEIMLLDLKEFQEVKKQGVKTLKKIKENRKDGYKN